MVDIDVRVGVRQLFCYQGADEEESEPYLWVIGFKLDGSTVQQNLTRLTWTPDFFFSSGSHGNLGAVAKPGYKITVPRNVGTWETTIKPIVLVDAQLNATEAPGAVGFIAVLLEENNVPDHAAEAGHQALNTFVAQSFSDFVTGIDLLDVNAKVAQRVAGGASKEQALEDEIKARFTSLQTTIKNGASGVVSTAMRQAMGADITELIWAGIDKDEQMGNAFQITTTRELISIHDFTTEYTDQIFDNEALPEAGDFAYNLHSYIRAKVKLRKIELVSALPADHDIQLQGIQTGYSRELHSSYIANVGGVVNGASWWLSRSQACQMIDNGEKSFYVLGSDGSHTQVISEMPQDGSYWAHLRTVGDDRPENNLYALPKLNTIPGFHQVEWVIEPDPFA